MQWYSETVAMSERVPHEYMADNSVAVDKIRDRLLLNCLVNLLRDLEEETPITLQWRHLLQRPNDPCRAFHDDLVVMVDFSRVEVRRIYVADPDPVDYSTWPLKRLAFSATGEIRRRIKGHWSRVRRQGVVRAVFRPLEKLFEHSDYGRNANS